MCACAPGHLMVGKYKYAGNKVETGTHLKDMSHILSDAWRSTEMTCWAVCQPPINVCVSVCSGKKKVQPQIAFNWRLKLSDSLQLSCQSRCSHHGDASQRSAPLTTSGNGWLWRTAREWVDRHTHGQTGWQRHRPSHKHVYRQMWSTQASTHRPEEGHT